MKIGLDGWKKNLDAAVERFKLAGTSKADISLVLKNHFSNGNGVEGDGKKVHNLGSDVPVEANKDNEILLGSGFVTHCRCNLVLKPVTYGVPMAAWPLYAEQVVNGVVLVEEMKLEIPVESKEGFVSAEEVVKKHIIPWIGFRIRILDQT
ncbi:hypothetical protein GBA52_002537 [Prunus armeniaca]|nr:hypothetical protein GBA52_002537 [Prunus armeniaca]